MKEFFEEDFKQIKGMVKDLSETVFQENKKGFIIHDCLLLISFSLVIDILLRKIQKEIKIEQEEKDEGNN